MANTFKNYVASDVGTAPNTVYTVPAATTSVMIGCNIANKTTAAIYIDVQLGSTYLVKGAPIPSGSALSVLDGKIIIETGETFVVTSDADTSADVVLSVLEQT